MSFVVGMKLDALANVASILNHCSLHLVGFILDLHMGTRSS